MSCSRHVLVVSQSGSTCDAELLIWEENPDNIDNVLIKLSYCREPAKLSSGENFFDALLGIRRLLEQEGLFLVCYGSSRNVYPSTMSRTMGYGEKAYKLSLGKKAETTDIVSIFDTGPDVDPATIEEQEEFYQQWLKSIQ